MRIVGTFAFVDMAGFTALTEAQGDEDAADLATMFAEITRAALGPGDRLVKTIGDAVLITSPSPAGCLTLVERLLTEAASESRLPTLRAGLHHGDAVQREGDVFGAAVNLAARVAAEAHPAEVLGTAPIAEAARALGIPVVDIGEVALKNVRHTTFLYSMALMLGATDTPIDPVCRNPIDRRTAAGRLRYQNREFWFCSLTCAAAFASNPEWHKNESMRPSGPAPK
jgi:class 3 adenylate cyclase/YHS domain-containing protein